MAIENLTPSDLSQLTRLQPITFDVTGLAPGEVVLVWVQYKGYRDKVLVYDALEPLTPDRFTSRFEGSSTRDDVSTTASFSILENGGWSGPLTLLRIYQGGTHEFAVFEFDYRYVFEPASEFADYGPITDPATEFEDYGLITDPIG